MTLVPKGSRTLSPEKSTLPRLKTEAEKDPVSRLQAGEKGPPPKIGRGGLPRRARCHRRSAWVWKATPLSSSKRGTSPRPNRKRIRSTLIASRSVAVTKDIRNTFTHFYRSAQSFSGRSSSSGSLLPEMMESEMPLPTSSPNKADDSEVSSRRVPLDQGTKEAVPEGGPPTIRDSGAGDNEGPGLSGSQPTVILETGEQIPSKDDCAFGAASGDPGLRICCGTCCGKHPSRGNSVP